jgi:hypothetical protein
MEPSSSQDWLSPLVSDILSKSGWFAGRDVSRSLSPPPQFDLFPKAEEVVSVPRTPFRKATLALIARSAKRSISRFCKRVDLKSRQVDQVLARWKANGLQTQSKAPLLMATHCKAL